jgi:hypothetical protein
MGRMIDATPALERIDEGFHGAYQRRCNDDESRCTVLVVLGDELVVRRGEERRARGFTPEAFHVIKRAAHHPVSAFLRASQGAAVLRQSAEMARRALTEAGAQLQGAAREDVQSLLQRTLTFLERGEPSTAFTFAREVGPLLLRLTHHATEVQLTALHAAVEEELANLDADARASLQVVVAGDHQARARSLGMQYFQLRLREHPGADERVTYGEGIETEDEAIALVATRRVDRRIAGAFFGDEKRLQRDVLGDAAAELLQGANLPPIE